jgi:hypothetical protein
LAKQVETEIKLCLAFCDFSALPPSATYRRGSASTAPVLNAALTSPMGQLALGESLLQEHDQSMGPNESIQYTRDWRDFGIKIPSAVLLVLLGLIFLDSLCFVFACILLHEVPTKGDLHKLSSFPLAIMFLFPPFAQPLCMMLGPLFIITEAPWCGRIYANLALFGTISPLTAAGWLVIVLQVDSRVFDVLEMFMIVLLKVAIYFVATMHIANLESCHDLCFADVDQADFLGVILSGNLQGGGSGGHSHMGPFGEQSLEDSPLKRRCSDMTIHEEADGEQCPLPLASSNSRSFGPLPVFPRPRAPARSRTVGTIVAEPSPF